MKLTSSCLYIVSIYQPATISMKQTTSHLRLSRGIRFSGRGRTAAMVLTSAIVLSLGSARDAQTWPFSRYSVWNMPIGSGAQYSAPDFTDGGVDLIAENSNEAERDPFMRPFAHDSIWNTPIGSNAEYVHAGVPFTPNNGHDWAYFLRLDESNPLRDFIYTGAWRARCSGTEKSGVQLHLPDGFLIPDAEQLPGGNWKTPNNGWEFLQPDGATLFASGAGGRCSETGPIFGHRRAVEVSIYGDGLIGGHGASRMPRIGGAIRKGELTGDQPIRHVLDLVLYTKWAYSDNKQTRESTYRWPASGADAYALNPEKTDRYIGTNPEMRMGSLLALPPGLTPEELDVTSQVGKKLFQALQDWGGYFTDDSAWNCNYLTIDAEAKDTFPWGQQERGELGRMVAALHVVTNNAPDTIGGGGTPRAEGHQPFKRNQ
jgi:hypothetical protein